jgi:hypothetical protein
MGVVYIKNKPGLYPVLLSPSGKTALNAVINTFAWLAVYDNTTCFRAEKRGEVVDAWPATPAVKLYMF